MRDSDRLALARERLALAMVKAKRVNDIIWHGWPNGAHESDALCDLLQDIEDALGQPVTPQSLFQGVEGGGM